MNGMYKLQVGVVALCWPIIHAVNNNKQMLQAGGSSMVAPPPGHCLC